MKALKPILLFIILSSLGRVVRAEAALVYFVSAAPPGKIEKFLKSQVNMDFSVFAKYGDFEMALEQQKPDLIVAPAAFKILALEYEPVQNFKVNNQEQSKFVLLALDKEWANKDFHSARIGAVEMIPREILKTYLGDLFSGAFKTVKTVSKAEDLFPLLVFKSVDFIAVEPDVFEQLKTNINMQIFQIGESKPFPTTTLWIKKGKSPPKEIEILKTIDLGRLK